MNRRRFLAATTGATIGGVAGCLGSEEEEIPEEDIVLTISIGRNEYDPKKEHVEVDDAVAWRNDTNSRRIVNANNQRGETDRWSIHSGDGLELEPGETGAYRFTESGVYSFHDWSKTSMTMCGAIAVGESTEDDIPTLTCEQEDEDEAQENDEQGQEDEVQDNETEGEAEDETQDNETEDEAQDETQDNETEDEAEDEVQDNETEETEDEE